LNLDLWTGATHVQFLPGFSGDGSESLQRIATKLRTDARVYENSDGAARSVMFFAWSDDK
jgi:hypothetical protein